MGHKHTKEEILAGALAAAVDEGLSQLTFGRLAKRLGISDRVIVYYFPTKDDLLGEVVMAMGAELQTTLAKAFTAPAANHVELIRAAWPIVATEEADPTFAMLFEAIGLATGGRDPFRSMAPALIELWIAWLTEFVEGPDEYRRAEAAAAVALIDGLLLLRQLAGSDTADRAARQLGLAPR